MPQCRQGMPTVLQRVEPSASTVRSRNPDVRDKTPQDAGPAGARIDIERELERRDDHIIVATCAKTIQIRSLAPTELDGVLQPRLAIDIWCAPQHVIRCQQRLKPLAVPRVQRFGKTRLQQTNIDRVRLLDRRTLG